MGYYNGTIQKGSSGDDVKKWQEYLNSQGYNLTVDGIFGDNTYSATTEWQGKNGLSVDGIVGANTWGKAGFSNINTPTSAPTTGNAPTAPTLTYNPFNTTTDGESLYKNMEDAYKAYTGFKDFSYDFNADALYQQYKDKYVQQGKMAMADAMGQAAAMTGGYGNSYAAAVGNQAYQAHLNNLNDIIPELYNMALNKYNTDYGKAKDAYSAASGAYYSAADLYKNEQDSINTLAQKAYENEFNLWDANNTNAWKQAEWEESMRRYERESAAKAIVADDDDNDDDDDDDEGGTKDSNGWFDFDEDKHKENVEEKGGSYYETAFTDIKGMAQKGKSTSEMLAYAEEMLGNSLISRSEYLTLAQWIREEGSLYTSHKVTRRYGGVTR